MIPQAMTRSPGDTEGWMPPEPPTRMSVVALVFSRTSGMISTGAETAVIQFIAQLVEGIFARCAELQAELDHRRSLGVDDGRADLRFKGSMQHRLVGTRIGVGRRLLRECAIGVSCADGCSGSW
jgi:hypothetical protein